MEKSTLKFLLRGIAVGSLCAFAATFAQAGGNGNGGSGGGGAHGAATSGMTYHSEPVSSPWNRVPGDLSKKPQMSDMDMHGMNGSDDGMPAKTGQ
ncbi:hypothetical protein [Paraburkholderia sp. BCC1884]|uniref:hypothetical protein n=1 Tax=Paraburkholderia sp. BCC1884 TaxID=2562668 RepID=UPI0011822FF5|nr:hypothetical protein [Paraburkholderia sp. BCC1884]